jgi:hypothetical protein
MAFIVILHSHVILQVLRSWTDGVPRPKPLEDQCLWQPGPKLASRLDRPWRRSGILHSHVYLPAALLIGFRDVPMIAASDPKLKVFKEETIMFLREDNTTTAGYVRKSVKWRSRP